MALQRSSDPDKYYREKLMPLQKKRNPDETLLVKDQDKDVVCCRICLDE
jgi:hypothetical protein